MPVSIEVDRGKQLTTFTASGDLTSKEQIDALSEYYRSDPTKNLVWDFRGVTGDRVTSNELRQVILFAKKHENLRSGGKTALVTSTDLDFGLGRMADAIAELEGLPWKIRAFRTMEEAMEWLNE